MSINNGDSAFPAATSLQSGMSLRDYFAAKALQGILAQPAARYSPTYETASEFAYQHADAMLKQRSK